MPITTLRESIDNVAAGRRTFNRHHPGFFWAGGKGGPGSDRCLSREEAKVLDIGYREFLRMISVREAWLCFLGIRPYTALHDERLVERERQLRPHIPREDRLDAFHQFATEVGGLTSRQADAIYFKDFFWSLRSGVRVYEDEQARPKAEQGRHKRRRVA